jgi:arylsulfatase
VAYRDTRFKYTFDVQFAKGMEIWRNPLTKLRAPFTIDLMTDPFEYAVDGSPVLYEKWLMDRAFLILPAVQKVGQYLASYKEFPPRQRPASFSIDQVIEALERATKAGTAR